MRLRLCLLLLAFFGTLPQLRGDAAVFLAEPYGAFGRMNPTGHAAVYLSRVCADTPTILRRCASGESGVVVSRYHKVAGYDWIAIPLIPYLYAVDRVEDVPTITDWQAVAALRNAFRRNHLSSFLPDNAEGEWVQLIGSSYDRRIFAFEIETSEAQDDAFIQYFNARENVSHFNLLSSNCADLAKEILNFYFPKAIRRSIVADTGITTPKQVAKSLLRYSRKHPELRFSVYAIPQIPGTIPRSRGVRGVLESLVKSKKYALPLLAVDIWFAPGIAAGYLTTGRFNPARYAKTIYQPEELEQRALLLAVLPTNGRPDQPPSLAHAASGRSLDSSHASGQP